MGDEALAALGAPPRLARLRLDYCVEVTDGGLALVQGMASLEQLSLDGCEQLTPLGLRHLAGLTRLRRLSLQTCHQVGWVVRQEAGACLLPPRWPNARSLAVCPALPSRPRFRCSELAALGRLSLLEVLDLGWCSAVGDVDAAVLPAFSRLRELSVARTRITDAGLAFMHGLDGLQRLSLAGLDVRWAGGREARGGARLWAQCKAGMNSTLLRASPLPPCSDDALAALVRRLPHLRRLNLERCGAAGDATLAALGQHVRPFEPLLASLLARTPACTRLCTLLAGSHLRPLHALPCPTGTPAGGALSRLHRRLRPRPAAPVQPGPAARAERRKLRAWRPRPAGGAGGPHQPALPGHQVRTAVAS